MPHGKGWSDGWHRTCREWRAARSARACLRASQGIASTWCSWLCRRRGQRRCGSGCPPRRRSRRCDRQSNGGSCFRSPPTHAWRTEARGGQLRERLDHLFLGLEVVVEGAGGEIGLADDVADSGGLNAHPDEDRARGIQNGFAIGCLGPCPPSVFLPWLCVGVGHVFPDFLVR